MPTDRKVQGKADESWESYRRYCARTRWIARFVLFAFAWPLYEVIRRSDPNPTWPTSTTWFNPLTAAFGAVVLTAAWFRNDP